MMEHDLLFRAAKAFGQTTGLRLIPEEPGPTKPTKSYPADGALTLFLPDEGPRRFIAECKNLVDRPAAITQIKLQLDHYYPNNKSILVSNYLTPALADHCRSIGLNFIDATGNAYLHDGNVYIFAKGNKADPRLLRDSSAYRGGVSSGSLRMTFALLCVPKLLSAPYRAIVDASGVSLGAVSWIFRDLEARGFVTPRDSNHERQFLDVTRLREEWATNFANKLRPKLKTRRFRASREDWWKDAIGEPTEFLWSGEVATYLLDEYLLPETQTIYLQSESKSTRSISSLVKRYRLRADPEGPIEILDGFWNFQDKYAKKSVVPPLLIYADLLAILDSRAQEAATLLRTKHLEG